MKNLKVTVRDFDAYKDIDREKSIPYQLGVKETIEKFNQKITSHWFNNELIQKDGETPEKYQARLRDLCVELMCSNRGYASCFVKLKAQY